MGEGGPVSLKPAELLRLHRLTLTSHLVPAGAHKALGSLTLVVGNLDYLRRRVGDQPQLVEAIDDALEGARRLGATLRYQREASLTGEPRRELLDPGALVERTRPGVEMLRVGGIAWEEALSPCPPIRGDSDQLGLLLLSLVSNACRAVSGSPGASIRLELAPAGDGVEIAVIDNGPGVAEGALERAFEPFWSGWSGAPGAGLGLPAARLIARLHGGGLTLESTPGRTRAALRLPAAEARPARGRVLLIDDDAMVRDALRRLLGRNHEVVTCASGNQAAALLASDTRFHLILSDVLMPDGSGRDLHAWITSHRPALLERLVFVTAGVYGTGLEGFKEACGLPWLEKPVEPDALLALAERYVARAAGTG